MMSADAPKAAPDDWDFYFCNVNDVLSSIMVNLAAIRRAPNKDKSWLLWAWVNMLDGRPDGLSSDVEASKLYEIETESVRASCGPGRNGSRTRMKVCASCRRRSTSARNDGGGLPTNGSKCMRAGSRSTYCRISSLRTARFPQLRTT
jgi:hypothetical protein